MAGAGYKLFATGDVLTAAQVNTYLMQQTVMVFASSAARTTALSGVLAEGMVSYLQDTNTLEVYDGSAWVGATGDITGLTAGTGISITSATGPVPTVAIDTAVTADLSTAQTLTNKTLTSPVLTTPSISNINAKGDILVGTADNTLGALTAGSNGETLVADSSATTGLRWQAPVAVNPIINGGSDIWQRSTSAAMNSSSYTYVGADRWLYYQSGGAGTVSRQTSSLEGIQYCQRLARNSGSTSTGNVVAFTNVESANSYAFAGKTVTFSFYARAGANFSAASSQMTAQLYTGTGTDQNLGFGGFTGSVTAVNQTPTLTTTWQRFQYTATLGSTVSQLGVWFQWTPVGTAGAADYIEVTGIQVEVGSVATPFRRSGGTIAGELAACQRYYWRFNSDAGNTFAWFATGLSKTTTTSAIWLPNPVSMRTGGTSVDFANLMITDVVNYNLAVSAATLSNAISSGSELSITNATGATALRAAILRANSSSAAYIGVSAEL